MAPDAAGGDGAADPFGGGGLGGAAGGGGGGIAASEEAMNAAYEAKMQLLSATTVPDGGAPLALRLFWYILHRHRINGGQTKPMFVYGGAIRDYIMRDDLHANLDLDAHVIGPPGDTWQQFKADLEQWGGNQTPRIQLSLLKQSGGPWVQGMYFSDAQGSKCEIEIVYTTEFGRRAKKNGETLVDMDVNNMKISLDGACKAKLGFKFPNPLGTGIQIPSLAEQAEIFDLEKMKSNCMKKEAWLLKTDHARIQRFQGRGWRLKWFQGYNGY